jgi:hypothetical protein
MTMPTKPLFLAIAIGFPLLGSIAHAQDFDMYIGGSNRDQNYGNDDYRDRGGARRNRGSCDPEAALDVAEQYGMRRVRIASITRDRIVVTGIGFEDERTRMVIRNDSRCRRIR